jgi:glutaredoxin
MNANATAAPRKKGLPVRTRLTIAMLITIAAMGVQGVRVWHQSTAAKQALATAKPGDIQMISSETCTYCTQARQWLQAHRVPFAECFVERDPACATAYQALNAPGTPVMVVRGKRLVGFDASAVAAALLPENSK